MIIHWLKDRDLYSTTPIYVTTDHGFDHKAKTHSNAPDGWLATNDPDVKTGGTLSDIAATILTRFGMDVTRLIPPLSGTPLIGVATMSGDR
jgi:hypothetical protein